MGIRSFWPTLVLGALCAPAAPLEIAGAFIDSIQGTVELSNQENGERPRVLHSKTDRGLILEKGDKLTCKSGGLVTGIVFEGPASALKSVTLCGAVATGVESKEKGLEEAAIKLKEYALAGRSKGDESPIFNPPDHGAVLPDNFVVQWRTRPPLDSFSALLLDRGAELARVSDVDGTRGELNSPELRKALFALKSKAGRGNELQLVFRFRNGSQQIQTFHVLTDAEISVLEERLASISRDSLFGFVQRAEIYDSFHLYGDVAAEYSRALALAPESRELIRAAQTGYARIGDLRHARELRDRLSALDSSGTDPADPASSPPGPGAPP